MTMRNSYLKVFQAAAACLAILLCQGCPSSDANRAHQTKIGNNILWSINAGEDEMPSDIFIGDSKKIKDMMPEGKTQTQTMFFLLKTPDKVCMFDAGKSDAGRKIEDAGIEPEDVSVIYLTHAHPDHIGGLVQNHKAVFPNAKIYISKLEAKRMEYQDENSKKEDAPDKKLYKEICDLYKNKVVVYNADGEQIERGITPLYAPGHTSGHTVFKIESKNDSALICGDIFYNIDLQLEDKNICVKFDEDKDGAISARNDIVDMLLSEPSMKCAGMHIKYPGIGHIAEKYGVVKFTLDKAK